MAIKGLDLTLHLISDLSVGAKGSVFKDSLSLLQLVIPQSFSSFLAFSLLSPSLSFKLSFIYIFPFFKGYQQLAYTSSKPCGSSLLPVPHCSVSLLSKRSWRVLTSFFNGCYTCYGQPCHSLPSLSLSLFLSTFLYYFHSFFFPIQVSSPGSHGSTSFYLMFLSSLFGFSTMWV